MLDAIDMAVSYRDIRWVIDMASKFTPLLNAISPSTTQAAHTEIKTLETSAVQPVVSESRQTISLACSSIKVN
jgi:hypothetical protein